MPDAVRSGGELLTGEILVGRMPVIGQAAVDKAVFFRLHDHFVARFLRQDAAAPHSRRLTPVRGDHKNSLFLAAGNALMHLSFCGTRWRHFQHGCHSICLRRQIRRLLMPPSLLYSMTHAIYVKSRLILYKTFSLLQRPYQTPAGTDTRGGQPNACRNSEISCTGPLTRNWAVECGSEVRRTRTPSGRSNVRQLWP